MTSGQPKLLDRVQAACRVRHFSRRTEEAYTGWIRRFILFHKKRHPDAMGAGEVSMFLSWLAVDQHVSASTQNQALSAGLFLYRDVLGLDLGSLPSIARARTPERLPVVLSREEVSAVLAQSSGVLRLMVLLLYGAGLRLGECLELRGPRFPVDTGDYFFPSSVALLACSFGGLIAGWNTPWRFRVLLALPAVMLLVTLMFTVLWFWPANAALWAIASASPNALHDQTEVIRLVNQWVSYDWLRVAVGAVGFVSSVRAISVPFPTLPNAQAATSGR